MKKTGGEGYLQIEGLLDKNIENRINARIKETAKTMNKAYSTICANFSNVLSVQITDDKGKIETINIDLSTGNDIPIEDVFVSSAPLNSLIMEGTFKALAWNELYKNYDMIEFDMNKVDTSKYEDIALNVVNNYYKKKDGIKYTIANNKISIYGLLSEYQSSTDYEEPIEIEFLKHSENIAIYKRYLTNESIYENDSIGEKGIIAYTQSMSVYKNVQNIVYGKIQDNIFMEEVIIDNTYYDTDNVNSKDAKANMLKYINKLVADDKQKLKSQISDNVGVFYQKSYRCIFNNQNSYYLINIDEHQATCDINYYKDGAFEDFVKIKNKPYGGEIELLAFEEYDKENFPKFKIPKANYTSLYFDQFGNFIGNTEKEAQAKTTEQEKPVQNQEPVNTNKTENNNSDQSKEKNENNTNTNVNTLEENENTSNTSNVTQ